MSAALDAWFVEEVLPLERRLIRYLLHARQPSAEIEDLRQEVFARVYEAARVQRPDPVWPYVYMVARNLIVDRLRREQVVAIDLLADPESLGAEGEEIPADRALAAKQDLTRLYAAIEALPDRCREVVRMRKIEGASQREVAARLGIAEHTVEKQVSKGLRRLAEALFGEPEVVGGDGDDEKMERRVGRAG
ncbi:MAG TPA: RNA polymerase sigma factor [Caulobacteraceae bacterium]